MSRRERKPRPFGTGAGFVLITMMLSLVVLLGFLGMAVDVGYVQLVKTRMQTAADAAALAGVQDLVMNGAGGITSAAKADSALNGFTDGVKSVVVTVHNPPTGGLYTTDPTAVEVLISETTSTFFMNAMGFASMSVKARSVACRGANSTCVYVLNPTANKAVAKTGTSDFVSPCGIYVNSSDVQALNQTGSGSIKTTPASTSIVGSYHITGSGTISPTPVSYVARPASIDPFASHPVPTLPGTCDYTNYSSSGAVTLNPGTYCGGIKLTGSSARTFKAGVYVLNGGGLDISGSGNATGTNVTFYITADAGHTYKGLSINGSGTYTFSAPTSGSYEAMLFIGDKTKASALGSTITGSTTMLLNGVVYLPKEALTFTGSTASASYQILVSDTLTLTGSTQLHNNYTTLASGPPVRGGGILGE